MRMKKVVVVLILFLLFIPLFSSPSFIYSFSQTGETIEGKNMGALAVGIGFVPDKEEHFGLVELVSYYGFSSPIYKGFDIAFSTPVFVTSDSFFSYCFSNPILWEPTIGASAQYRRDSDSWAFSLLLSPFKFVDTSFSYEILSPYFSFGLNGEKGWGIRVMKITAFLEI